VIGRATGYAKLNLALHVRRRRGDGYHDIETLFAFCEHGDELSVAQAEHDSLAVTGEFSAGLSGGADNLVVRALGKLRELAGKGVIPPLAITLDKRLPVAAGIGGGSADAGAIARLLSGLFLPEATPDELVAALAPLGADVGACVVSRIRRGSGTGAALMPVAVDDVAGLPVLLINPRIALPTGPVFAGWDGVDRGALPEASARTVALSGRNDLENPACALVPAIATLLDWLSRQRGVMLARMSGSGATCFALFEDADDRNRAAHDAVVAFPGWWTMSSRLR